MSIHGWIEFCLCVCVCHRSVLVVSEHGRPTGIAFVEFPSPAEATAAMGKNRQVLGTRWIEIFAASRADLER